MRDIDMLLARGGRTLRFRTHAHSKRVSTSHSPIYSLLIHTYKHTYYTSTPAIVEKEIYSWDFENIYIYIQEDDDYDDDDDDEKSHRVNSVCKEQPPQYRCGPKGFFQEKGIYFNLRILFTGDPSYSHSRTH